MGEVNDTQTGMPSGIPEGAMCVQRFDDSLNSAIHITYRILLRSSSMPEPRDPLLKVLLHFVLKTKSDLTFDKGVEKTFGRHRTIEVRYEISNRPTKATG